jgi:acetylornithine aminotransferase
VFGSGQHGSTYGGSPLACATALAVVNTIAEQDLCANATAMGQLIVDTLKERLSETDNGLNKIVEIRGRGLMLGIELREDCHELVQKALSAKLLINVTTGNTIRLLPPLIINAAEARSLGCALAELIR